MDAQRTALHEKLTRLAETRQELDMPEAHTSGELDALTASAQPKPHVAKVASKRVNRPATAAHACLRRMRRGPQASKNHRWEKSLDSIELRNGRLRPAANNDGGRQLR